MYYLKFKNLDDDIVIRYPFLEGKWSDDVVNDGYAYTFEHFNYLSWAEYIYKTLSPLLSDGQDAKSFYAVDATGNIQSSFEIKASLNNNIVTISVSNGRLSSYFLVYDSYPFSILSVMHFNPGFTSDSMDAGNSIVFTGTGSLRRYGAGIGGAFAIDIEKNMLYLPQISYKNVDNAKVTIYKSSADLPPTALFEFDVSTLLIPPLVDGGISEAGGGLGNFDGSSDTIGIPGLPTLSAVDTGFVSLYNPTLGELRDLASYMWSTDLIDNILKAFADPMDAILGLSIVPVTVPEGGTRNVRIGNITSSVIMTTAASQYVSVDCGTLQVQEYWGSALDYSPNTKAQLILPYIGAREIDVDEIMNKSVHIVYHVDILTGACVCFVSANDSVIYQFEGSCANQIPITGSNWTQVLTTAVQVAGNAAAFVATAGGSGAVQASTALSGLANTAGNVMNSKPRIEHSGNVTGGGGQMSVQVPYLIVQRPRQSLPVNYNKYEGYPSNITAKLADLRGFTSIESIHLEGVNATDQELEEIQQLLRGGVII